jgi:O-antigen/teichoic acid export membrane protein
LTTLTRNALANYAGQAYTTLIGIVMLPLYLRYLGVEAYGLVGFFSVLLAWFGLLDIGLSPALSRQVARHRSEQGGNQDIRLLLRTIEYLFGAIAVVIVVLILLGSHWLASEWLHVRSLPDQQVVYCIDLMGAMIGLRWFAALYRGGVQGLEQMVWLNGANIALATVRFAGAYALLRWVSVDAGHFFEFQLLNGLLEVVVLGLRFYRQTSDGAAGAARFSLSALRAVLPFASGLAYTSAIWVLVTQTDKLILSHTLSIREYGYFTLVAVISNGLLTLGAPVNQAILPRMTRLHGAGDAAAMLGVYRVATRYVCAVIVPLTLYIALCAGPIVLAWTHDAQAAQLAAQVLPWYIVGSGILTVGSLPYCLQFAHGNIRLHVANSTINAVVQAPIMIYAATYHGPVGVAYAWLAIRLLTFLVFPAVVHARFAPGLHRRWLFIDVVAPAALAAVVMTGVATLCASLGIQGRGLLQLMAIGLAVASGLNLLLARPSSRRRVLSGGAAPT